MKVGREISPRCESSVRFPRLLGSGWDMMLKEAFSLFNLKHIIMDHFLIGPIEFTIYSLSTVTVETEINNYDLMLK